MIVIFQITLLLTCFTEAENNLAEISEIEEREKYVKEISQYNRMHSNDPISVSDKTNFLRSLLLDYV